MGDINIYKKITLLPPESKKEVDDLVDSLLANSEDDKAKKKMKPGLAKGLINMKEDFDEPLEDFNDYMFE